MVLPWLLSKQDDFLLCIVGSWSPVSLDSGINIIASLCGIHFVIDKLADTLHECAISENLSTGSESSFRLGSFWLDECLRTHSKCPQPGLDGFMPSRVVDVGPADGSRAPRLHDTRIDPVPDHARRYCALSHCWGKDTIITTTNSTLTQRLGRIEMPTLSKTFQDAVMVARRLSVRYVWIDSLCIIQDDADDWAKESVQMCNIYRQAIFTIGAAHASGGNVGCFVQRDGILNLPFELSFQLTGCQAPKPFRALFTPFARKYPLSQVDTAEPPLYGRAWVQQEQMLSPRMLIFEADQMRWECLSVHGSERSPLSGASRQAGYFKKIQNGIAERDRDFFHPNTDDVLYTYMDWYIAVMEYTHRGMTQSSDRVVAIAGIAKAIQERTADQYLSGLWKASLWRGLLWSIPFANEYTPTTMYAYTLAECSRHNKKIAPSWSWQSVTTPVVYPIPLISSSNLFPICEVLDVVNGDASVTSTGRITIRGDVRTLYMKSTYQPVVLEVHAIDPDERVIHPHVPLSRPFQPKDPLDIPGSPLSLMPDKTKYDPETFMQASSKPPTKSSDFQLFPGNWRPDEILAPESPIHFIAIAQTPRGNRPGYLGENDPLQVYTLGLQSTGKAEGEFRRVGYAVWHDCAWYGYDCNQGRQKKASAFLSSVGGIDRGAKTVKSWLDGSKKKLSAPSSRSHDHLATTRSTYQHTVIVKHKVMTIV
jgi:hypothetical protein